jgi:hypothetical protein
LYEIEAILFNVDLGSIRVYIRNEKNETLMWKEFNHNMPVAIEYNISY